MSSFINAQRATYTHTGGASAEQVGTRVSELGEILKTELEIFVEKKQLSVEQSKFLQQLQDSGDMMVSAALEVYDIDRDLEELCDTLRTIARVRMPDDGREGERE